jgi:hypothetical protein
MKSLMENRKLFNMLLLPIIGAFVMTMNPGDEYLDYLSITYEGVPDEVSDMPTPPNPYQQARQELQFMFIKLIGVTLIIEAVLKTMKYREYYGGWKNALMKVII